MKKIKQAVFQARNFFLSSISRAEILIDRKRSKSMSQAGFDVTRYSSRRASIPIASRFFHSNLRQNASEFKSMAATEDFSVCKGFLFQNSRSCTSFSRQRWVLRLVTSFHPDGRQIGLEVSLGSSTHILISFSILLLFFGKRLFPLVTIYLKLTEMSRKNKKKEPAPFLWRIGLDGIRGMNLNFSPSPFPPGSVPYLSQQKGQESVFSYAYTTTTKDHLLERQQMRAYALSCSLGERLSWKKVEYDF